MNDKQKYLGKLGWDRLNTIKYLKSTYYYTDKINKKPNKITFEKQKQTVTIDFNN